MYMYCETLSRFESVVLKTKENVISLGDNTVISNIEIHVPFFFDYDIENLFKLSRYWKIAINQIYRD